jgi:hypothetical protein
MVEPEGKRSAAHSRALSEAIFSLEAKHLFVEIGGIVVAQAAFISTHDFLRSASSDLSA